MQEKLNLGSDRNIPQAVFWWTV